MRLLSFYFHLQANTCEVLDRTGELTLTVRGTQVASLGANRLQLTHAPRAIAAPSRPLRSHTMGRQWWPSKQMEMWNLRLKDQWLKVPSYPCLYLQNCHHPWYRPEVLDCMFFDWLPCLKSPYPPISANGNWWRVRTSPKEGKAAFIHNLTAVYVNLLKKRSTSCQE